MGGIIDKTKTKVGKSETVALVSAPLICLGLIITFSANSGWSDGGKLCTATT